MARTPLSEVIAKLKSNDPTFTILDLREVEVNVNPVGPYNSHFNDESLLNLAAAIQANQTLKRFIFKSLSHYHSNTDWTHIGAKAIGSALKDHPELDELHLALDLTGMSSAEVCGLLQALSGKAKIKNLYLTANLTDDVLELLGKSIANNTTLERITIKASEAFYESQHKEDVLKTFAEGFAGKSLQHLNLKLRLNDDSIKILSQHLSKTNTLKTIILNRCNITQTSITSITNILKKNPSLTDLDLCDNPLGSSGIKSLVSALPNLPQLKALALNHTNLDAEALDCLAEVWQKSNLKIRALEIGMPSAYDDAYISAVKKIIKNNKYLKKIAMVDGKFQIEHFYQLQDLLQNPNECRLQQFIFGRFFKGDDDFNNAIFDTLKRNHHLTKLAPPHRPSSLTAAWKANQVIQKKSQQLFIEKAISFSVMFFAPREDDKLPSHLSWLPEGVFLLILYQLGRQEAFGMNDEDIIQCAGLIFDNFSTRKKLMTEEKYSPIKEINSNSKSEVGKWWSLSSRGDNSKRIFQQRTVEDGRAEVDQANSESHALQDNKTIDSTPAKPSTECNMM